MRINGGGYVKFIKQLLLTGGRSGASVEGLVQSLDNTPILSHINTQWPGMTTLISP